MHFFFFFLFQFGFEEETCRLWEAVIAGIWGDLSRTQRNYCQAAVCLRVNNLAPARIPGVGNLLGCRFIIPTVLPLL